MDRGPFTKNIIFNDNYYYLTVVKIHLVEIQGRFSRGQSLDRKRFLHVLYNLLLHDCTIDTGPPCTLINTYNVLINKISIYSLVALLHLGRCQSTNGKFEK